ncbi:OB-fold domain-containing protein [Pseudarthrobacter sp. lyk4-40-TYG-27]|jgi:hypothetical protein|uniref:Zn-ribbon domain-containing OB-fold protein n=1 Tax=Pseudarthrobacter sp. lyk4-40-TYG-27 TaxID=3040305 RepID=UPI0025562F3C|nr:OB-fold domain-containing protein [Pseudarthrobacter sp. lyk4-40-TYG-27]
MTTVITNRTYLKPVPQCTPENQPFWDAMAEHRFLVPRCQDCGTYGWVPYPACRECLSENLEWTQVSGEATVYSFTIVHRGPGAFNEDAPYAIVAAALAEDPVRLVLLANTTGIPNEDLKIGMPVRIAYEDLPNEDITLWRVGPA